MPNKLEFPVPAQVEEGSQQTESVYSRASSTIVYPADATTEDQMMVVEASGVLDFWDEVVEDVYDERDGDVV